MDYACLRPMPSEENVDRPNSAADAWRTRPVWLPQISSQSSPQSTSAHAPSPSPDQQPSSIPPPFPSPLPPSPRYSYSKEQMRAVAKAEPSFSTEPNVPSDLLKRNKSQTPPKRHCYTREQLLALRPLVPPAPPLNTLPLTELTTFGQLRLPDYILSALSKHNFSTPTPIQSTAIPPARLGADIIAHARSGTGKTACFVLVALLHLTNLRKSPQVIVLVPTRELADQVCAVFNTLSETTDPRITICCLKGGNSEAANMDALRRGADIIVGTPGRVWAMTRRGALSVDHVSMLILDEADRLLDDSYEGAVNDICGLLPEKKQTLAFSATFSPWLRKLLQRLLTHPLYINVTPTSKDAENLSEDVAELRRAVLNGVRQQRVFLKEQGLNPKLAQLNAILQKHPFSLCIVFSNVKHHAAKIATFLRKHHYKACAINADVPQREREQAVKRVRQGALHVLIATDLLARGVDFDTCDLVVHLDVPEAPATYLHRVGRAGRYGRKGRSITLYDGAARGSVEALEAAIGMSIGVSPAEPACPQGRLGEDGKNRPPSKTMTEEAEGYNGNIREGNGASELHHREFETAAGVASDHTAKGSSRTLGNGPNKIAEHQEHTHVPPSGTHPPAPLNSPQQARTHAPGNSLNSSQKPSMLTKTPKPSPVKKRLLQLWNPHTKRMRLQPPNEASGQDRSNNDANTVAVSIDERVYAERRSPQAPLDRPARRVHSQAANGDIANAANEIDVEENSDVDDIRPVSPQPPDLQGLDPAYSTAGSPLHRNEQTARKSTAASDPPTQAEHIATERNTEGEEDPWDKIAADAYDAGYKEAYATAFKMATELQKRLDWASG